MGVSNYSPAWGAVTNKKINQSGINSMAKILVSGLVNIETTLRVEGFPIAYTPVRYPFFGVNSSVSGVGYNIARALTVLGDDVRFLSLIGKDPMVKLVRAALERDRIPGENVLELLDHTAQSVILYDGEGRRQINVDLKNIQETAYPPARYAKAAQRLRSAGDGEHQLFAPVLGSGAKSRAAGGDRRACGDRFERCLQSGFYARCKCAVYEP
jgi:hypothetical protein